MTGILNGPTAGDCAEESASPRFLPLLLLLFMGSGCAALIYEIVWFQLLQLVIGSSAISLGVLLGTFMGGMCLGSLLLPRLITAHRHPLRVYAVLEAGIGVLGLLVLFGLPYVARFYVAAVGHGVANILMRGGLCALCLLPPTLLMGATLPAISRWVQTTPRGVSWLGFFYGGNIAGAVFGCLLAGFYLLRVHDMATATSWPPASTSPWRSCRPGTGKPGASAIEKQGGRFGMDEKRRRLFVGVSGNWLVGGLRVGRGSGLDAAVVPVARRHGLHLFHHPGRVPGGTGTWQQSWGVLGTGDGAAAVCAGLLPTVADGRYCLDRVHALRSLPYWPINPVALRQSLVQFPARPGALLLGHPAGDDPVGRQFPARALAAVASPGQDPGRMVGRVYAANTVGAIVGAVGTSVFLIASTGTQHTQQVFILTSAVAASLMFVPSILASRPGPKPEAPDESTTKDQDLAATAAASNWRGANLAWGMAAILVGIALAWSVPPLPWKLVAFGRYLPTYSDDRKLLYLGEGMNASVAVTEMSDGVRNFHISGKVEASTDPQDMRLQRMLGDIPGFFTRISGRC